MSEKSRSQDVMFLGR